jgi:hypothetical protein
MGLREVSTDAVRQELFGGEKGAADDGQGAYGPAATQQTYQALVEQGRARLAADGGVVLDGTFLRAADRAQVRRMASSAGAAVRWIECELPADLVRERMVRRRQRHEGLSDATWDIYLRQRDEYAAGRHEREDGRLVLDMSRNFQECARRATDWLRDT